MAASLSFIVMMMLAIWMFMYLVQHPACRSIERSCIIKRANGTIEDTGLWGNCAYLTKCLNNEPYKMEDYGWLKIQ